MTYQEGFLRTRLRFYVESDPLLEEMAVDVFVCTHMRPSLRAYVLDGEALLLPKGSYVFCVFLKTPGKKRLFVGDKVYYDREEAQRDARSYLKFFPFYGFSKRFLF